MAFLTVDEKQRIAEAIKDAECRTSGEIVTVIARTSDGYAFIPLLWGSGLALLTPLYFSLHDIAVRWDLAWNAGTSLQVDFLGVYMLQLVVFIGFGLLFRWQPIKMRVIPKAVKRRRAARMARQQFLEQGVHRTAGRTGVLLFVSVAERYVEVLADSGINDKVGPDTWDGLVANFVAKVKADQVAEGFLEAVATCGTLLAEHFPKPPSDKNELPNHLIEF